MKYLLKHIIPILAFLLAFPLAALSQELRDVDFHVVMKNKNDGKKEFEAVQYCVVKSLKKAHEIRVSMQKAISHQEEDITAEPGIYVRRAAEKEKVELYVSANNGTFRVNASDGMAVVVIAQSQYVEVREILPGQQRYFVEIETRVLDEVVKIDRRRRGPDFSNVRGYDTGHEIRFSCPVYLPAGIANEDSRLFIQPIVIDCETEDTVAYANPVVFEGLKYHMLQVRRKGFDYYRNDPVGKYYNSSIQLNAKEDFEFTHEAVAKKPDRNRVYRGCYRVLVEDYTHIIYDSGPVGNSRCLNIHPFKFLNFGSVAAELPISEDFQPQTQSKFATPGDAVAEYLLHKDDFISGRRTLSDGDLYTLFATILNKDELDDLTNLAYRQIVSQQGYELNNFSAYVANRKAVMQIRKGLPNLDILRPFIDYNIKRVDMKRQTNWFSSVTVNREEHLINQAIMMFQTLRLDTAAYILDWLPKDEKSNRVSVFVDSISENWDAIYAELYKTLPDNIEEERYDPAGFTRINVAKNFNSLDYKLDRRYLPTGESRRLGLFSNAWLEGGFGIEQLLEDLDGYSFGPLASAHLALGRHLDEKNALRLRGFGGYSYRDYDGKLMYKIGGKLDYLYDFSSMFFGYQSDRLLTVSSVLGAGATYTSYKEESLGMNYEGHAGLQAKFTTSPHGSVAIEPYVGIASAAGSGNLKNFNFFYGANLSYIYYIDNQLSKEKRRRAIKERDLLDEITSDSTLYSWRKPFFVEMSGAVNRYVDWNVSVGQWLSTSLAVRLSLGQVEWQTKRDDMTIRRSFTGRVEGLFNPLGLKKYYLWDSPFGAYVIGGMVVGELHFGYTFGAHAYARLSDAVQVFVEPRFEHDTYHGKDLTSIMLGFTVTSRSRHRTDWTKAEEKDYADHLGRITLAAGLPGELFAEYRLNGYHSLRADYCKSFIGKSDYAPNEGMLSFAYMLSLSNLFTHINPYGRLFEMSAFTGPTAIVDKSHKPQYTWHGGAKLQCNIARPLALYLSPTYYVKTKEMALNMGLQITL